MAKKKKNRYKRRKSDGTFDFVENTKRKHIVSLGMIDWFIMRIEKWEKMKEL